MFKGLINNGALKATLLLASVASMVSCGSSASNNDQGTSFTAIGFYADEGDTGVGLIRAALFGDVGVVNQGTTNFIGQTDNNEFTIWMGVSNRLSTQFVRVVRIDCDYEVEGSFIEIPSDSTATGFVLEGVGVAPAAAEGVATETGTSQAFMPFQVISPDLYSFLNNNINLLPQLPFRMTATCSATGVTQAGDTLTTNSLNMPVQFFDSPECCVGADPQSPGFAGGPGTGGTLITAPEDQQTGNVFVGSTEAFGELEAGEGNVIDTEGAEVIDLN